MFPKSNIKVSVDVFFNLLESMCPRSEMPVGLTYPQPTVCYGFNSLDRIDNKENVTLVNAKVSKNLLLLHYCPWHLSSTSCLQVSWNPL